MTESNITQADLSRSTATEADVERAFRVYGIRRTPSGVGDTITIKWSMPRPQSNE